MLNLFDTGRMAYKYGKWRGAIYLVSIAAPLAIANFIASVLGLLPGNPSLPDVLRWLEIGLYALALFLCTYGFYRLYRDHVHFDHDVDADRYKHEGW